jgi:hypothetical protein
LVCGREGSGEASTLLRESKQTETQSILSPNKKPKKPKLQKIAIIIIIIIILHHFGNNNESKSRKKKMRTIIRVRGVVHGATKVKCRGSRCCGRRHRWPLLVPSVVPVLEHGKTIINGTGPALLAAFVEHVRPLPLRDRSAQKAQHESARTHTHTLALYLSCSRPPSSLSSGSSLVWSWDHPPSSSGSGSGSGSSLVHGLVIVLSLHLVPVPVWCVVL